MTNIIKTLEIPNIVSFLNICIDIIRTGNVNQSQFSSNEYVRKLIINSPMDPKKTYQCISVYNELFIDFAHKRKVEQNNREFWYAMDNLHQMFPECNILVEKYVIRHFSTGIAEDVRIKCDSPKVQEIANQIYDTHYYVVPLNLSSLGDGKRDDAIDYLLNSDSGNSKEPTENQYNH